MANAPGIALDVKGDPIAALIAQLNRFRERDKNSVAGIFRKTPLPLMTPLTQPIAAEALALLVERLYVAEGAIEDTGTRSERNRLISYQASGTELAFVQANLAKTIQTLALYGDKQGLPPASYGITGNTWDALTWAGALALSAIASFTATFVLRRARAR